MTQNTALQEAVTKYIAFVVDDYRRWMIASNPERTNMEYFTQALADFTAGSHAKTCKAYIKVMTGRPGMQSVHSFIVLEDGPQFKQGDILKPAGANAPAKNFKRGNVLANEYASTTWTGP